MAAELSLAGGKGVNVARALKRLGVPVQAVGLSGGVSGQMLHALLDEEKIAHIFSPVKGVPRTNVTAVSGNGIVRRKIGLGPRVTKKEREVFRLLYAREMRAVSIVVFSGSLPLKFPVKDFADLVVDAQHSGVHVAVDTSGPALQTALDLGVDIIKPNREEAEDVLGFKLSSRTMIRKALRTFMSYGIKKVLISLGEAGIAASDGREAVLIRMPVVKRGHSVGCGDAALAGFLRGYLKHRDFKTCVAYAAACGCANMLTDVPGGIVKKDVEDAFRRKEIIWL